MAQQDYNNLNTCSQLSSMSSHNIDENSMLRYICLCFQLWGINYISRDILKKAKDNAPQCCKPLTRLIFDLAILEMLQHEYTINALGIQIDSEDQFLEEFVLSFLSESNCPYIQSQAYQGGHHSLDFSQSSSLLLIAGWVMAKTDFFSRIRTKLINNKFSDLYINKKYSKGKGRNKQGVILNNDSIKKKGYEDLNPNIQRIQIMYKKLNQHNTKIQNLEKKKSQIYIKLNKQISQYNKMNQTNIKIESIIREGNSQQDIVKQQEELQILVSESLKGMKNQQYFWMWLQYKIIQPEFKQLQNEYPDQYEKVQAPNKAQWAKMNPEYLSRYDRQYKQLLQRIEEINEYFSSIQPLLSAKPIKDQASIRKQIFHDAEKILKQQNPEFLAQIGIPCFLKLEVIKYCQKKGFGPKNKKNKKNRKAASVQKGNGNQQQLRQNIAQFIDNLNQIKFI